MIVSITRLRLKSFARLPSFMFHSRNSIAQAVADPDCVAASVFVGPGLTFWTATAWKTEVAISNYVRSGLHRRTLQILPRICSEAAVARLIADRLPEKKDLVENFENPRFIGVFHPTSDQERGRISRRNPWFERAFKNSIL